MKATIFLAGIVAGVALAAAFVLGRASATPTAQAAPARASLGQVVSQLKTLNRTVSKTSADIRQIRESTVGLSGAPLWLTSLDTCRNTSVLVGLNGERCEIQ